MHNRRQNETLRRNENSVTDPFGYDEELDLVKTPRTEAEKKRDAAIASKRYHRQCVYAWRWIMKNHPDVYEAIRARVVQEFPR